MNREGKYRTFHLADEAFFGNLKRTPYLINSSRVEVVSAEALLQALETGQIKDAVIDTWEGEPDISLELLRKVFVGTPHIAGYSADGKANATRMSLEALCQYFGKSAEFGIVPPVLPEKTYSENPEEAYLEVYNPMDDCLRLKESPEKFEWFRGNYPLRRELF